MTTLADIARQCGVTPQAVAKWRDSAVEKYGELQFEQVGKRKEYRADGVTKILEFATSRPVQPVSQPSSQPTSQPSSQPDNPLPTSKITIYEGNHQVTLPNPSLSNEFSLDVLRTGSDVFSYDDPLELAKSVIAQNQQLIGAMTAHRQRQIDQLTQATQALQAVQQSNQSLKAQASQYQLDAHSHGVELNQVTQQLGAAVAEQQSLGKSPTGEQSPQSA